LVSKKVYLLYENNTYENNTYDTETIESDSELDFYFFFRMQKKTKYDINFVTNVT